MSSFSLSGGVEVTGFISPTDTNDTYPVIDPLYGIDGFRNVNLITDLNTIPEPRRRAGMVVGVSGGAAYYKLNSSPWNYTISDWSLFQTGSGSVSGEYLPLSGGTVTGSTTFTSGVFSNTISATTYQNLPIDIRVTGGTYSNGTTTFINNTGGTFNVTGYYTGDSGNNQYVTGFTYNNNQFTISDNSGNTFNATINTVTGLTVNGSISATTYQNLPLDIRVTGGTYSNGTTIFTNNTGGTFNVTGFYTGGTDVFVTGGTYFGSTITFTNNTGGTFTVTGITSSTSTSFTGGTVTGATTFTNGLTANTISATTYQNLPTDIRVTGGTYSNGTTIFTNNTGGTFNVTGFYTGATDNDRYVTGFTYNNNTFTISDNSGSTFNATINTVTGLTVNGNLSVTGNTTVKGITGTTALFSGSGQSILTIVGSGSTLPLFSIVGSSGELFSVTDSLVGSLFSVNDISGLPILEVFSDNTVIMGDYLSPSLNTTKRVSAGIGTTTIYTIPISAYTGAFFDYTVSDGTNLRSGNIMSIFNSSTIRYSETSTTDIGNTNGITFNMVISGGTSAVLQTSGTTSGWTVKTIVRSI